MNLLPRATLIFSVLVFAIEPAHAYLDPGTGSILLQGLIGGVAAGFAVISMNYHRAKAALSRWFSSEEKTEEK